MMEAHARAPDPLTKSNDMASNWHSWKEDFIIFMKVTGYIDKSNEIRANLLKNRIGKIGIDAIQTMSFDNPQDKDDMDILIAKLEEFFNPPKNEVVERFQFFTRDRKQNETIEQYINILKEKAKTCNFNDITDSIIRDKIILGTQDKILRKKFLETKNLDLPKLVAIYNDHNINMEKMKEVTKESTESVSSIQKPPNNDIKKKCWRCNCQHPQGKCPAWGSKCTKCGDVNHFTQCCKGPNFKPNFKPHDNKINNVLNPMEEAKMNLTQQIGVSKSNNKKDNQANSKVKDVNPMNQMTGFPDIPTVSYGAPNSTFCNDFVILGGPSPNLHSDNGSIQTVRFPKNIQNNRSKSKSRKPK
ncbi:uncharacterized protein [Polyergus mexicanus]|uniref:uncharacterized protein isoform X2 n=1 Tax=Polyergus mexicanus TaxID=615972 RepID=UPI0038B46418